MPRKNEAFVERLVEAALRKKGYENASLEFQGSDDDLIASLLPSKRPGSRERGRPDFIARVPESNILLVVEVKDGTSTHTSLAPDADPNTATLRPQKFAEDGVVHYMRGSGEDFQGLREQFDVLGLAVSCERGGRANPELRVTGFRALKKGRVERVEPLRAIPSPSKAREFVEGGRPAPYNETAMRVFAATLHDFLRDDMELSKDEKPLLVSAIMLALSVHWFRESYYKHTSAEELTDTAYQAVVHALQKAKLDEAKRNAMLETYRLLKTNGDVRRHMPRAVALIDRQLGSYLQSGVMARDSFDILGHFYREFLRYTGGDKQNLGIVLTPKHVCDLFVSLAAPRPERDVVIDVCAGTGGFLVAAMAAMVEAADGQAAVVRGVKERRIAGIEKRPNLFTVACANMILRGDGKSNMHQGDAITDDEVLARVRRLRPTVALLNPPYSKAKDPQHEYAFVMTSLELLQRDGTCIALVPMSLATATGGKAAEWKRRLLAKHTLHAVMSMPAELFPGVGVVTCAMVFKAHRPHQGTRTWLALWKDDGFRLRKGDRVEASEGAWKARLSEWLDGYRSQAVVASRSILVTLGHDQEWCAEAYLEPDYSTLTEEVFAEAVQRYALHRLRLTAGSTVQSAEE